MRLAGNVQHTAQSFNPLPHAGKPEVRTRRIRRGGDIKSAAIVCDGNFHAAVGKLATNVDTPGLAMSGSVFHRFLTGQQEATRNAGGKR